jgi:hypothetical protein
MVGRGQSPAAAADQARFDWNAITAETFFFEPTQKWPDIQPLPHERQPGEAN